jgi:RNA polymerase sigma-70 factor (ECF subfamily)
MADEKEVDAQFHSLRGKLFGVAYRMLGSRAEAEDIVQESYVRWRQSEQDAVRNVESWLVTIATRLSIDRLRALKVERESYVGPWLPEPLISETERPDRKIELEDDLSIAFLVLLERLGPEERGAFLLHEVFDRGYGEIAGILDKSEAACRQLIHRARERVRRDEKRFSATDEARTHLLDQFTAAVDARDEKALIALFTADAAWTADGGGRTAASPRPILGVEKIVRLVLGLQALFHRQRATMQMAEVNGQTELLVHIGDQLTAVLAIEFDSERIQNVYAIVNPEKLGGLSQT